MTATIRLIGGGDVMLGEHPVMVGRGVATRIRRGRGYDPLAGVAPLLRGADLAVANLESPLSDPPRFCLPSTRECRGPAGAADLLAAAGFDALTVANNHMQQHGPGAVRATVDALEARGIAAVGLAGERPGTCRPVDRAIAGLPVRLLGYSLRPRQHFTGTPLYAEGTREGILADVAAGRAAGAVVVVCIHWGDEFVAAPSRAQVDLGRAMVDAGAALVLGHHPHVLQGWERHGHGVIAYSLGNLVFDMPWLGELRRTALLECALSPAGCGDVTVHPCWIGDDHRPVPATGPVREEILAFLADARRQLEAGDGPLAAAAPSDYDGAVAASVVRERWARNRYFARNLWRYRPDVAAQLVGKFVMRRVGLLRD